MMLKITPSNYLAWWYITNEMSIMDALHYTAPSSRLHPLQSGRSLLTTYFISRAGATKENQSSLDISLSEDYPN